MASYTIPEEIIGTPLFVPDAYDYFSIGAGELPNGDDCLVIHGDVSQTFLAFQAAPVLSPAYFTSKTVAMSMTCWLKVPTTGGVTSQPGRYQLFSIQNANFNGDAWSGGQGSIKFGVGLGNPAVGRLQCGFAATDASNDVFRDNTWHLMTWLFKNGSANGEIIRDLDTTGTSVPGGGTAPAANQRICIGSYSKLGNMNGANVEWRMGKWAFHDHELNQTERAILYNAMMA